MDSILEDSVDEDNLADPNNDLVDTIFEMFTNDHTLDYSFPPLYDDVNRETKLNLESDNVGENQENFPSFPEYDWVIYEDFIRDLPRSEASRAHGVLSFSIIELQILSFNLGI
ncbi:hypothetical protein Tco_0801464 [Tanacetum coccineum]|uniref:Uncharacterized protein n=1 Tax=Tanacetum coccineum TaxID=301880 RepID=A0ABQ4ZYB9_9ASTR